MKQYHRHPVVSGFTVIEMLISLAIMGILLAALAAAFSASMINYQENEKIFRNINAARQALIRMTGEIRTAGTVNPSEPPHRCSLINDNDEDITFEYRLGKLYIITNSNGNEYVLCENVSACTFAKTPTDSGLDTKSVQIALTIQSGNYEQKLVAAAVVRKVLNR